jgi:hypothetical protein
MRFAFDGRTSIGVDHDGSVENSVFVRSNIGTTITTLSFFASAAKTSADQE